MTTPVVTRFAPSPTGYLHIGGARTALFNWLYAKHTGGRMLLRIEDTDRERSTDAAITAILDGMTWLGLDWSGEPVHQFARAGRHREVADDLLARGLAYRCYATAEELNEMRALARAEGRSARYDGRWRDRDPSEAPAGVAPSIRIRAPRDGETVIEDHVQGRVAFPNADLDDFVILRSDGIEAHESFCEFVQVLPARSGARVTTSLCQSEGAYEIRMHTISEPDPESGTRVLFFSDGAFWTEVGPCS